MYTLTKILICSVSGKSQSQVEGSDKKASVTSTKEK